MKRNTVINQCFIVVIFFASFSFGSETEIIKLPSAFLPKIVFEFKHVPEGTKVKHDFIIKNRGSDALEIYKVLTGWGCSTVSFPSRITAGGSGVISIELNTDGYGGRTVQKSIEVKTNDQLNSKLSFVIIGKVDKVVNINPKIVRFVGPINKILKKEVTIIAEEKYPFKIIEVKAKDGKNINVILTEKDDLGKKGYKLIIKNRFKNEGRYYDTILLSTNNPSINKIKIRVFGNILKSSE